MDIFEEVFVNNSPHELAEILRAYTKETGTIILDDINKLRSLKMKTFFKLISQNFQNFVHE